MIYLICSSKDKNRSGRLLITNDKCYSYEMIYLIMQWMTFLFILLFCYFMKWSTFEKEN